MNLSQQKRERLLNFIKELKSNNSFDEKSLIELNEIENELNGKKYGLVWEEHEEAVDVQMKEAVPVFAEDKTKEIVSEKDAPYNFLLEGDNLHSLYLLEKTHKGKIDIILIDPPYNTGNEDFIYNDKKINLNDSFRHSQWLSFMSRRLDIAQRLLSKNGIIFIHIDDNEQAQLKLLCDEIFGSENLVNCISIKMSEATSVKMAHVKRRLPKMKEYVLVYKKDNIDLCNIQIPKNDWDDEYRIIIDKITKEELDMVKDILYSEEPDEEDIARIDEILKSVEFKNVNTFINDNWSDEEKIKFKYENAWRIVRDVATTDGAKTIADSKKNHSGNAFLILTPRKKVYLIKNGYSDSASQPRIKLLFADNYLTLNPGDFWQDIKTTGLEVEGGVEFKKGKKPLKAEKRLLELANKKDAIVLDFFAGSGTTAEAVAIMNKEDGGNRKVILCTNNEVDTVDEVDFLVKRGYIPQMPSKKQKKKYEEWQKVYEEYSNTEEYLKVTKSKEFQDLGIAKRITYPRIKNIANGYSNNLPIKINLKYFETAFVSKNTKNLSKELTKHVKELIELEWGVSIDKKVNLMVMTEEELDKIEANWDKLKTTVKSIYRARQVVYTSKQKQLFKNINNFIIPDYYFNNELKEVGENW